MTPLYAFTIIVIVMALGNMIAVKTKSIISMLFAISIFFLIAFWLGLPTTIFADSGLLALGSMLIPLLLVHMGTSMNVKQLAEQWRTVLIALAAILGVAISVIGIGQFFVGIESAMVAAAPISGGVIAGIQMGQAATAIGIPDLAILASLLVVVQGFIGYPVASFVLKKEAEIFKKKYRTNKSSVSGDGPTQTTVEESRIIDIQPSLRSDEWYLAKTAIIASLAMLLSQGVQHLTGINLLDTNILALLFGVLFHQFNLIDRNPLNKAQSYGLAMASLTVVVVSSLSQATPELLLNILPTIVITLLLGAVGIIIFSFIVGKLLKVSPWMSIGIGISALFGFPGTFIVPNEVAHSVGETPEEVAAIVEELQPRMLVAGFITVSIASVVLAGILAPILVGMVS